MSRRKRITAISAGILIATFLLGMSDQYFFKITRAFEIYGGIFREVTQNYVLELDPEDLMKSGIEGMLSTLDPYTEFFDESDTEDIDIIATGLYTGLGITVGMRDSMLTIVDISDDHSAKNNGLRIGDRIYKIDTSIVLNGTNRDLRKHTRGTAGTKVDIWVLREGITDTLQVKLTRKQIRLKNVTYSGFVSDSIGYIKIVRFSRGAAEEVRSAIYDLRQTGKLAGLILDLRDNPGGLLESAVSICEIFLPKGSPIVATKGRISFNDTQYNSMLDPSEPDLPLAALINETSASASEVLAGALQDLDRAVIVGQTSFGKGLVQSVIELPFKTSLKMTTAKYYTPSGRCIQRIEYGKKYSKGSVTENPDTSVFYTKNGRKVYESKGVKPDSLVDNEELNPFVNKLINDFYVFNWATKFTAGFDTLKNDFEIDNKMMKDFKEYIKKTDLPSESRALRKFREFKNSSENAGLSKKTKKLMDELEKSVEKETKSIIDENYEDISNVLEFEISRRFLKQNDVIEKYFKYDKTLNAAVELLKPFNYRKILAVGANSNKTKSNK